MSSVHLEQQLREFETQRFPTDAQTVTNNAQVLYKCKKYFLDQLWQSITFVGYLLSALIYMKDASLLVLFLHAGTQFIIVSHKNAFSMPSVVSEKAASKYLLVTTCFANTCCILGHVLSTPGPTGGLIISFLPERTPYKAELLVYDVIVFFVQLVCHCMATMRTEELMADTPRGQLDDFGARADSCGDGYNGDVYLTRIDVMRRCFDVMKYRIDFEALYAQEQAEAGPMPTVGAYV